MLYHSTRPADIYRRVELDARVEGSNGIGLTRFCLDEAISEIERATFAHARNNTRARNEALTRAASGISALHRGVAQDNPMHGPLTHLYGAAERALRGAVINYRPETLARVQEDLRDIRLMVL